MPDYPDPTEESLKAKRDAQLASMFGSDSEVAAPDENLIAQITQEPMTTIQMDRIIELMKDGSAVRMEWQNGHRVFYKVGKTSPDDVISLASTPIKTLQDKGFTVSGQPISFSSIFKTPPRNYSYAEAVDAVKTNQVPMKPDPVLEAFMNRRQENQEFLKTEGRKFVAEQAKEFIAKHAPRTILLRHHDHASFTEAQELQKLLHLQGHQTALVSDNVKVEQVGTEKDRLPLLIMQYKSDEDASYCYRLAETIRDKFEVLIVRDTIQVTTGQVIESWPNMAAIMADDRLDFRVQPANPGNAKEVLAAAEIERLMKEGIQQDKPCSCCGKKPSFHAKVTMHESGYTVGVDIGRQEIGHAALMTCVQCARESWGFADGQVTKCELHR